MKPVTFKAHGESLRRPSQSSEFSIYRIIIKLLIFDSDDYIYLGFRASCTRAGPLFSYVSSAWLCGATMLSSKRKVQLSEYAEDQFVATNTALVV
jgi:hypothetical protein